MLGKWVFSFYPDEILTQQPFPMIQQTALGLCCKIVVGDIWGHP